MNTLQWLESIIYRRIGLCRKPLLNQKLAGSTLYSPAMSFSLYFKGVSFKMKSSENRSQVLTASWLYLFSATTELAVWSVAQDEINANVSLSVLSTNSKEILKLKLP